MPDVNISYKGESIASMDESGSKTLNTKGKYCEDNITVQYTDPEKPTQTKSVTPSESAQTVTPDSGKVLSSVSVGAIPSNYVGTGVTRKAAQTITPGTADQTIASATYLTGTQTIKGDANLVPANIVSGKTIFGVSGSHTCATPSGTIEITTNGTHDVTNYASAEVNVPSTGIDTSDATATASDIRSGVTAYVNGERITGSLLTLANGFGTPGSLTVSGEKNIMLTYKGADDHIIRNGTYLFASASEFGDATAADVASGKTFTSAAGLKVTGTKVDLDTSDATATATDILSGKTAYVNGSKITGSISSKAAATYTPTTTDQTIAASQYLTGAQTVKGDANLVAANIKEGVSIFGVQGSHSGGITPSGTISITENGTKDVTNYASASVNVDIHTTVVSLSSDVTAGNATLLSGNAFVKANYSNSKFFCGFARVQTDADTSGQYVSSGFASNFYNHLNRYYCCWGGNGTSLKTWSSAGEGYKASANYKGTGYAHVHADSSGNIIAHAPSSYTIKAGKYAVFYGVAG